MNPRELVLEQLKSLQNEKKELVDKILETESDRLEEIKAFAAARAEEEFKAELEEKVAGQFKIAEEHLNRLLESLPVEEINEQTTEENFNDEESII